MRESFDISHFYDPTSYVNRQLLLSLGKFSSYLPLPVFAGTFNVGNRKFPGDSSFLRPWLHYFSRHQVPDAPAPSCPLVYAIGFQEVDMSAKALMVGETSRAQPWVDAVASVLGDQYVLSYKQMMGLLLVIGLHKSITCPPASAVVEGFKACGVGLWNRGGNKGGLAATIRLYDTRILFCNLHLSANRTPDGPKKRNRDIYEVLSRLSMSTSPKDPRGPTIFELYHRDSKPGVEILDDYIIEDELNHPIVNPNYNFTNCLANCNFDSNLTPKFPSLLRGHDVIFLLGDLNYRLHTFSTKPHLILEHFLADSEVGRRTFLRIDQLSMQLRVLSSSSYTPTYANENMRVGDDVDAEDDATFFVQNVAATAAVAALAVSGADIESDDDDVEVTPPTLAGNTNYYDEYLSYPFDPCSYLYGFKEMDITFNPTYKILIGEKGKGKSKSKKLAQSKQGSKQEQPPAAPCQPMQLIPGGSLNLFDVLNVVSTEPATERTTPDPQACVDAVSSAPSLSSQLSHPSTSNTATIPNYEVDPEASKPRAPAYCDRILFRGLSQDTLINPIGYMSVSAVEFSDHHPVCLLSTINVRVLDDAKLKTEQAKILGRLPIFTKELQPRYTLLESTLDFGRVSYGIETAHPLPLRNDHPISSLNIVLDPITTPPWIYMRPACFTLKAMTQGEIVLLHRFRYFLDTPPNVQASYIRHLMQTVEKPDTLSLESFESQRAFILRQIIDEKISLQSFTISLCFVSGRVTTLSRNNVIATENISCKIEYLGLKESLFSKPLHDLVRKSSALVPGYFINIANYFEEFLSSGSPSNQNVSAVQAFQASNCTFKTKQLDDILLGLYDTLKAEDTNMELSSTPLRFIATVFPHIHTGPTTQSLSSFLEQHRLADPVPQARKFSAIDNEREKEKLYLLFYHLCITGIESLRAHMSQSGEVSVLDPLLEKLRTELQSFRYYCTRSLFVSLGPAEDSNKLYIHLTKGDWARIPLYIHPASVAELLVDCVFSLPNGMFPEYSYYIIDSVIAAGMPTDLDSLRKQATGIFYTTLQWEESNLFLFFVSLFRFFLHTCKLPNHGFRFQSALRILAKMTFRSAEKRARNREDEAYMLAFLAE
ncbi:Type II inositol-1,4,5-trisphosphate 5-phosphatase [Giardia duodenalis]|uniref:Type II inositol-1,4,5-trisphosphate 5-phosphatase n=1 Tax=Giardia intestinalis TaxID=5741 RepID=V6TES0_GIAIN|nr:Type II inositol-1,4,5-trisphosphate 5-phosphatase [Giardia intestinalis]